MFGLSPLVAAVVAALGAFLLSHWWFGVHRRRKAETSAPPIRLPGSQVRRQSSRASESSRSFRLAHTSTGAARTKV